MENNRENKFLASNSKTLFSSTSIIESEYLPNTNKEFTHKFIPHIDNNIINLISEYIEKFPNKETQKHIARLIIKFVINTTNL